ncbi:Asp-tRNA(Asn)/Glu-tRNA(Gln) amidotransferase subunit GatA [Salipaludibacillus aurantiacus]|uniref:Glutamyl-tRNA(Gln) amidotransferase subunit A n=1 Tax=Salipaludibacillus aurantiacus TaxID=1601833 RepID=A0A1H9TS38_9BACI|nr:Asp-tRNA(Asn)/Glu-tRNA(Gln) amidotransferase subunit GatA [Salipaludibacillus aurantiacus]SER99889.1 aspartyl-tRNA(Asn)/glutamyl-tRNA(Gln) amidotransferase subunit A [Salipaludibacillus aurantiacus]
MELFDHTLSDLHELLHKQEVTVTDLVKESFKRIKEVDDKVGAFLLLNEENAMAQAKKLDEQLSEGKADPSEILFGLPVGIKDNMMTLGMKTTAASQILDNFEPVYNATAVEKLIDANTITVGKLNMDEFAMGSSNENSSYKLCRNPWDLSRVPGGSSGGSAAAVASGQVPFTLGSDTGGSIREPAAFCGVVGLKPTYGRVSRYGLIAFASSLDQIGPITRTVEDNAYVMQKIAGHDHRDSTSVDKPVPDYLKALTGDIKGMKIGVPKEFLAAGVEDGVKARIKEALAKLEELGATCEEVSLPHSKYALPAYYILSSSEASANLARFDGIRYGVRKEENELLQTYKKTRSEGFGDEVKRRIMLGTFALSSGYYDAYYTKAQKVRTLVKEDFEDLFLQYDVLIGPTTPTVPFKIGENVEDPLTMYVNDILTNLMNLAGVPAISVPCGQADGLPVGLQIIGKHFDEETVYKVAHAFEQATDHHKMKPEL